MKKMSDKTTTTTTTTLETSEAKILVGRPPKHLQIIKSRLKTSFHRKTTDNNASTNNVDKSNLEDLSIIRERGQSVTAECCSLGARSVG